MININLYDKFYQILLRERIGAVSFFFVLNLDLDNPRPTDGKWFLAIFRLLASAKPRPITIDILQYLGLELANNNAYAYFYFKIFRIVQEIGLVSFVF